MCERDLLTMFYRCKIISKNELTVFQFIQFKPVTDEEVSMTSFYMTSFICQVHVCICNKFYMTSFHMTSFTLLV